MAKHNDYSIADETLKKNLNIMYSEFCQEHPKLLTRAQFYSRRAALKGNPYKNKLFKDLRTTLNASKKSIALQNNIPSEIVIDKLNSIINNYRPDSKHIKEFKKIAQILMQKPKISYGPLKQDKIITMSNTEFYQFRKYFQAILAGSKSLESIKPLEEVKEIKISRPYRRNVLCRTVFTKPENTYTKDGVMLLNEVLTELSSMSDVFRQNVEVIEILNRGIEIRVFPKR